MLVLLVEEQTMSAGLFGLGEQAHVTSDPQSAPPFGVWP